LIVLILVKISKLMKLTSLLYLYLLIIFSSCNHCEIKDGTYINGEKEILVKTFNGKYELEFNNNTEKQFLVVDCKDKSISISADKGSLIFLEQKYTYISPEQLEVRKKEKLIQDSIDEMDFMMPDSAAL